MIEIEKNFDLKPGDKERIVRGAEFLRKKVFTDVYYDSKDFRLTRADYWLRERDGKWELKVPVRSIATRDGGIDRYTELESETEIIKELRLPPDNPLNQSLQKEGIIPFARIVTNRETYQMSEFHLDFDEMDFGFSTFEVELMVSSPADIPEAERKIEEFARAHGISSTKARGKVIQYLYINNTDHFEALKNAGVIRE